ncbi:hypothetical protein HCN44_000270 [Aphidius gifuensis]|uniref:Uncharacterized protein n=1 Tax=Aphidius gifuensis TaxID=684658 RepID=A0A834XNN3_APHGI|nr:probable RNA 3'-terminal phosphate cyclase-like protein [Aphidius gifuensis]XP_044012252.1 probable RNA 3'-terminal phosphate cyclase-like protein [Aphidius gifuensis]KAF7990465.1 hypothetical protein HCN44_000270 [Aphidius gifuensis]
MITYRVSDFVKRRLLLSTFSGKSVTIKNIELNPDEPGAKESVMMLAPFCKHPIDMKLRGVTSDTTDPSVDKIESSGLPILKKFIIGDCDVDLTIKKRGAAPNSGGEVHFKCPVNRGLKRIQFEKCRLIQRIRGISCSIKVSPAIANRMVEAAKGVLLNFVPDV